VGGSSSKKSNWMSSSRGSMTCRIYPLFRLDKGNAPGAT
jgi:hypothetical protein